MVNAKEQDIKLIRLLQGSFLLLPMSHYQVASSYDWGHLTAASTSLVCYSYYQCHQGFLLNSCDANLLSCESLSSALGSEQVAYENGLRYNKSPSDASLDLVFSRPTDARDLLNQGMNSCG